jgi:hypothetical protein
MNIQQVQQRLNELGYGPLKTDGENGPKTEAAVKTFQAAWGLEADGKVGPKTLSALFPFAPEQLTSTNLKPWLSKSQSISERAKDIAFAQVGVRERTGQNDGPAVESFLRSVGLGKGYSWCMAFIYWAYETAANELGIKNPLVKTGGVLYQWNNTNLIKTKTPRTGDIFIMDYGGGNGHTGLVLGFSGDGTKINTLEGNTNPGGSRNGDGVYLRVREISSIKGFIHVM